MIVLDTHALLWWALDPEQLSGAARDAVRAMERDGGFVSAISLWELAIEVKRGKLQLPLSVEELHQRIVRGHALEVVPVDAELWLRSVSLPWEHSDPADRVIVATALARRLPVLTKDTAIHAFTGVQTIW